MDLLINWDTKIITIPKSELTWISGVLYELDTDVFRLALKALEASEEGIVFADTHRHNTEVILGGVTYARFIEIINAYTVTFETGQYGVNLIGSNNNILDVANVNQVSIRSSNSAGFVVYRGSVTEEDIDTFVQGFLNANILNYVDPSTIGATLRNVEGLNQSNFRIRDQVYDEITLVGGSKKWVLTSATIRIYSNATDTTSDLNHVAQYLLTASYDSNGNCTTYYVTKV
jgi:hypothetical protein